MPAPQMVRAPSCMKELAASALHGLTVIQVYVHQSVADPGRCLGDLGFPVSEGAQSLD